MTRRVPDARGVVVINLQRRYGVPRAPVSAFARDLRRRLRLGSKEFTICLVDDNAIRRLNLAFRGKDKATDVLSFPWGGSKGSIPAEPRSPFRLRKRVGITNFLGDVVISVPTARRNARREGHSTLNEIRWLVLHGVLHLLSYDHQRDSGEMTALELALREELGVAGGSQREREVKRHNAKGESQKFKRTRI